MKAILICMNYKTYQQHICDNFKENATVIGLEKGYTKFCCFLGKWDSHAKSIHYTKKKWPLRKLHTHTCNKKHSSSASCRYVWSAAATSSYLIAPHEKISWRHKTELTQHSQSCVRNTQDLAWRRLGWVYSLAHRYVNSSENLVSLTVMTRRQSSMTFDMLRLVF